MTSEGQEDRVLVGTLTRGIPRPKTLGAIQTTPGPFWQFCSTVRF